MTDILNFLLYHLQNFSLYVLGGIIFLAKLLFIPVATFVIATLIFQLIAKILPGMKSGMGSSLIDAKFSPETSTVRLKDVAGIDDVMVEVLEVLTFYNKSQQYDDIGAKMPKGIILHGAPGTGKTLLAKAIAGELNTSFYATSGSEFNEMFVGSGPKKIRELFKQARKTGGIIFIDEIDAIGGKRDQKVLDTEKMATLNQLLVEMDGFSTTSNVLVVAATNRLNSLDDALLRPGRFDKKIAVPLPGVKGREQLLNLYLNKCKSAKDINIESINRRTAGFSGADICNLVNEAALNAVRVGNLEITQSDLEFAWEKIIAGLRDSSKVIDEKTKYRTAVHEIGHAIASVALKEGSVEKISILPRGNGALGYNLIVPGEKNLMTKEDVVNEIGILMAGAAAEQLILGNASNGLSNDLSKATALAKQAIAQWGMGKNLITQEKDSYSLTKEAAELIKLSSDNIKTILDTHKDFLLEQARYLVDKEVIEGIDFQNSFAAASLN